MNCDLINMIYLYYYIEVIVFYIEVCVIQIKDGYVKILILLNFRSVL